MSDNDQTSHHQSLQFKSIAQIAQIGVWAAAVAAIGYVFTFIPNVEGITLSVALAGAVLGPINGASIGAIGITLYSLFNPWGAPSGLLLITQIFAFATIGFCAGILNKCISENKKVRLLIWSILGLVFSLWYDILTTLITPFLAEMSESSLITILIMQIPFSIVKGGTNLILFAILFEPLRNRIEKLKFTSLTMRIK